MMRVFQTQNAKTIKGEALGYLTLIRYLAPGDLSGVEVCPARGACAESCLVSAGRAKAFASITRARLEKTWWRIEDRAGHLDAAAEEIERAVRRSESSGLKVAVRCNGTSDLVADAVELARRFHGVQHYDYTKVFRHALRRDLPSNLHLTLSYDPVTVPWRACRRALAQGLNVAVVFDVRPGAALPRSFGGVRVVDGDAHDLRFLDGRGVVVGLRAKGDAKGRLDFART